MATVAVNVTNAVGTTDLTDSSACMPPAPREGGYGLTKVSSAKV